VLVLVSVRTTFRTDNHHVNSTVIKAQIVLISLAPEETPIFSMTTQLRGSLTPYNPRFASLSKYNHGRAKFFDLEVFYSFSEF
jgi:hypothetical protein